MTAAADRQPLPLPIRAAQEREHSVRGQFGIPVINADHDCDNWFEYIVRRAIFAGALSLVIIGRKQ